MSRADDKKLPRRRGFYQQDPAAAATPTLSAATPTSSAASPTSEPAPTPPTSAPAYTSDPASAALTTFYLHSLLMFTAPLLTFFALRRVLRDYYAVAAPADQLWPALAAVVLVNLIIVSFVRKGFQEVAREQEEMAATTEVDKDK